MNSKRLFNFKSGYRSIFGLFACIFVMAGISACDTSSSSTDVPATFEIRMHDAPTDDLAEVNIHVLEVRVQHSSKGWVTISEPDKTYNLLDLVNGEVVILGEEDVEGGRYNQVRLILGADNTVVNHDGEVFDLKTPSAQQSGLKININSDLEEGVRYVLILDFDASKSIVRTGNSPVQDYILKPVIRAYELAQTGTIGGSIVPSQSMSRIDAIVADTVYTSTYAETNGEFLLVGLEPITYTVRVNARIGDFAPTTITDVTVETGAKTNLGIIELALN
jgi:hypothetical protein